MLIKDVQKWVHGKLLENPMKKKHWITITYQRIIVQNWVVQKINAYKTLLHDEQCKDGSVAFQLELHLQQTGPLFGSEPYKHPKITKLNRNTPWIKYNKIIINIV
jgi:hypothetical protein